MNQLYEPLFTSVQARKIDQQLIKRSGIAADQLMQYAAQACLDEIKRSYPHAKSITLLAGAGNNGGDAYALACLLHRTPCTLRVFSLSGGHSSQAVAERARRAYLALGGVIEEELDESCLDKTQLIVDALFGVGLNRPLNQKACDWIRAVNKTPTPVLSLDVPSGLNADNGAEMPLAVEAEVTVTFIVRKRGLYTAAGRDRCGIIVFDDLLHRRGKAASKFTDWGSASAWLLDSAQPPPKRPPRPNNSHKHDYGHVLVIGGDSGMGGAALLAAEAALRSGAGLVSLATRAEHLSACLARCPAVMVHAIEQAEELDALLDRASLIVLGIGLSNSDWSLALCERALLSDLPKVVDAGALRYIAGRSCHHPDWILTPHPGEAASLLDTTAAIVQADRFSAAERITKRYGGICILKGAGSIVCSREHTIVCAGGSPMLAAAGTGDVLSGIVAALYALGLPAATAAEHAVLVHARAGEQAARRGHAGLIAADLLPCIRY